MEVCDIMNKNLIYILFISLLFISLLFVNIIFAQSSGFTLDNANIGTIMSELVCASTPVACVEGKVVGLLKTATLEAIKKNNPELYNAISTMNQLKGFVDQGNAIINNIKVSNEGVIESGTIKLSDEEQSFGNLVNPEFEADAVKGKNVEFSREGGNSFITFNKTEGYLKLNGDEFKNIKPNGLNNKAFIKLDEKGMITNADLTASEDTSFVFNDKKIDVKKDMNVRYQDGVINLYGKEYDKINLYDKVTDSEGKSSFTNGHEITLGNDKGRRVFIEGNNVRGTNFWVDDLGVSGFGNSINPMGEVSIVKEGYLLGENTVGEKDRLSMTTKHGSDLLIANSIDSSRNFDNWILPEKNRLRGKGGFKVKFSEGNQWAKIDSNDLFEIDSDNLLFDLRNRDDVGKIPELIVEGDFRINENGKSISKNGEKVLVSKGTLFSENVEESSTSPIELLIKDPNSNKGYRDESYIVSNFKGIAIVPNGEQYGFTDERYANSIYKKEASTDLRYNYPNIENFERITGKKLSIVEGINNPEIIRTLIDVYEQNPEMAYNGVTKVAVYPSNAFSGYYSGLTKTLTISTSNLNNDEIFNTIIHEAGHGIHFSTYKGIVYPLSESVVDEKWMDTLPISYNEVKSNYFSGWDYRDEDLLKHKELYEREGLYNFESGFNDMPYGGFVSPYGSNDILEDIATYREKIIVDPGFFNKFRLIDDTSENPFYDPAYKKKIDLLLEYGFITEQEYDAVFHPEKYGLN